MGDLFNTIQNGSKEDNEYFVSKEIDSYLLDKDFYESTMNPRFMGETGYNDLTIGSPCLRCDLTVKDEYTFRIFINKIDIYYEVQNDYNSYESSRRYDAKLYNSVEEIDNLLDEMLKSAFDFFDLVF